MTEQEPSPHTSARYDRIGNNYAQFRFTEPTWLEAIDAALGDAATVLNIGAGTGNYEQQDRFVASIEPSRTMLGQRRSNRASATQAVAEALPFADDAFDATMGVLTMHHWRDRHRGLEEAARVAQHHVFTVYEKVTHAMWLVEYFPESLALDMEVDPPTASFIDEVLKVVDEQILWVPADCQEGFAAASWARPHDYLDPAKQRAISCLAMLPDHVRAAGTERLRADLDSGKWHAKHGHLLEMDKADFGYRLVTARRR